MAKKRKHGGVKTPAQKPVSRVEGFGESLEDSRGSASFDASEG